MKVRIQNWTSRSNVRTHGFTLIEVLLVVVIILMLAAALVVFVLPQQKGAQKNTTRVLLNQLQTALDTYRLNVGRYPSEEEGGLGALLVKPNYENEKMGERWQGPYLKPGTKLEDPWGNQLRYEPVDATTVDASDQQNGLPYKLYSVGPDGQPDTEDDIKLVDDSAATGADANAVMDQ